MIRRGQWAWLITATALAPPAGLADEPYYAWKERNFAIAEPLGGLTGNAERGREWVVRKDKGNCLACHRMPIPDTGPHGNLGPPLVGIAARMNEGELRLRVVDQKVVNPQTIMPGFYRHPRHFNRALPGRKRTILTAQEVEDVVAYLLTLK